MLPRESTLDTNCPWKSSSPGSQKPIIRIYHNRRTIQDTIVFDAIAPGLKNPWRILSDVMIMQQLLQIIERSKLYLHHKEKAR